MPPEISAVGDGVSQPVYRERNQRGVLSDYVNIIECSKEQGNALGSGQPRFATTAIARVTGDFLQMNGERRPEVWGGYCHITPTTTHSGEHHGRLVALWNDVRRLG